MRVHWGLGLGLLLIGAACAGMPGIGGPASEEASDEAIGSTPSGDGASEKATRSKNRHGSPPAGITALGDGSWQVDRNLVRKWQDRPERLAAGSQKDRGFMLKKVGRKDARFSDSRTGTSCCRSTAAPWAPRRKPPLPTRS